MAMLLARPTCAALAAGRGEVRHVAPRRAVVVRYRKDASGKNEGGNVVVYTASDPLGGLCPGSQAVIMALLEKRLPFSEVKVDLGAKPADFVELYHSVIPDVDVRERVPVLVNGSDILVDGPTIVEYLAAAYPDSGTPLTPPDAYTAARVRLFSSYFADHVIPAASHLLKASDPAAVQDAREALLRALAAVDAFLGLHGAGWGDAALGPHWGWSMSSAGDDQGSRGEAEHYLMGPFYTTADLLASPHIARMVDALPEVRGLDVLAECEARKLSRVAGWMRACLARPSAQLVSPKREELAAGHAAWEWSHAM
ncbi:GSTU2 [Scenedesmus sp. PABB004]|nr:GSTU2 [Scenedesmus sp. PABB004]